MMKHTGLSIVIAVALAFVMDLRAQDPNVEKASFIYNLAKLVEWPQSVLGMPPRPILVCVLGDDAFADALASEVAGKKIDGRSMVIQCPRGEELEELKEGAAHILFIAAQERARADEVIQAMKESPVLTIADWPGFARRGGIINFMLQDGKVRFEVNVDAARQASLNISSRLLSLARVVQTSEISR
jgi:hypothetical protein